MKQEETHFIGLDRMLFGNFFVSLELSKCSGTNSTNSSVAAYVACNIDVVRTLSELHITADTIFTEHNVSVF